MINHRLISEWKPVFDWWLEDPDSRTMLFRQRSEPCFFKEDGHLWSSNNDEITEIIKNDDSVALRKLIVENKIFRTPDGLRIHSDPNADFRYSDDNYDVWCCPDLELDKQSLIASLATYIKSQGFCRKLQLKHNVSCEDFGDNCLTCWKLHLLDEAEALNWDIYDVINSFKRIVSDTASGIKLKGPGCDQ